MNYGSYIMIPYYSNPQIYYQNQNQSYTFCGNNYGNNYKYGNIPNIETKEFFKYLVKKFQNPLAMKLSSITIIDRILCSLHQNKQVNYVDISIIMFDFAIKMKGYQDLDGKRLFGFYDCGFYGKNEYEIKLDFTMKFSEYLSKCNLNYNKLINEYIEAIRKFTDCQKQELEAIENIQTKK